MDFGEKYFEEYFARWIWGEILFEKINLFRSLSPSRRNELDQLLAHLSLFHDDDNTIRWESMGVMFSVATKMMMVLEVMLMMVVMMRVMKMLITSCSSQCASPLAEAQWEGSAQSSPTTLW